MISFQLDIPTLKYVIEQHRPLTLKVSGQMINLWVTQYQDLFFVDDDGAVMNHQIDHDTEVEREFPERITQILHQYQIGHFDDRLSVCGTVKDLNQRIHQLLQGIEAIQNLKSKVVALN